MPINKFLKVLILPDKFSSLLIDERSLLFIFLVENNEWNIFLRKVAPLA